MSWWFYFPEEDLIEVVQREIHSKKTIERIVVDIEREIHIPPAISSNEIRGLVEQMLNDHHSMMIGKNLQGIDDRVQKLEENIGKQTVTAPIISTPVDLTPIHNAIEQIQSAQQQIEIRLGQVENRPNASQFEEKSREIEALRKELVDQSQNYVNLKSAFDIQTRENTTLKQKISEQEKRFLELEEKNAQQIREISEVKKELESLRETLKRLMEANLASPTPPAPPQPWIKSFSLSKSTSPEAFFHGEGTIVKMKLVQSIQNMDGLITYLTQSKITEPARTSFMKNLNWCEEALLKLYRNFDFDGCDSEEISEEITSRFFKIISEYLLDNVMVAIYRGGKDAVGYQEFLQNVNSYLSKQGIYTEDIVPGTMIEGGMLSDIDPPISKETTVATDDGKVDEVELLPYFMFYEDDDGNLDTVRKRGRVVRLKYGA